MSKKIITKRARRIDFISMIKVKRGEEASKVNLTPDIFLKKSNAFIVYNIIYNV